MLNTNKKSSDDPYKITLPEFDLARILGGASKKSMNPKDILEAIDVRSGEQVADFGSGVGFFIIEVAQIVGPTGKVYAVDIDQNMLEAVKAKALNSGLRNIYGILANLEKTGATKLEDASMDMVLMINLLYLINDKKAVLTEAFRILKTNGRMVIMDWSEKGEHTMIEKEETVLKEVKEIAKEMGFKKLKDFQAGLSHEVHVFLK